jgi:hypothetical protein
VARSPGEKQRGTIKKLSPNGESQRKKKRVKYVISIFARDLADK